ncbi:MAG: chitobiase/beta-hexosaminidase C-terminal domain-containing protein [Kiritimatiellia bacterium]
MGLVLMATWVSAFGAVKVTGVAARQRYPWNGKVDIVVMLAGESNEVAWAECRFVATNSTTQTALKVASVTRVGDDSGSGATWTRRFVWDATADVGEVQIADVALTVEVTPGGIQLWADGPYWAEYNVGATKPEEPGYHFWWGDTVGYKWVMRESVYGKDRWEAVDGSRIGFPFWDHSDCPTHDKNASSLRSEGYIDSDYNLVAKHDAATAHLGAPWRMPTGTEMGALVANCTTMWTMSNGAPGWLVTGKGVFASRSIFLPAAGEGYAFGLLSSGSNGYYWSSTVDSSDSRSVWGIDFNSGGFRARTFRSRYYGWSVRPLREFANASYGVVITYLALDCRTGARVATGTESIVLSPAWETDAEGAVATIAVNGEVVHTTMAADIFEWTPPCDGTYELAHSVTVNGKPIGETLRATFVAEGFSPQPVTFTPVSGTTFETSLSVVLACASPGATIHYTTDGSIPTMESPVYKRFRISGKTTVKAIAFYENGAASDVAVAEYAFGRCADPVVTAVDSFSGSKTKVEIACATPGAVIRYTLDGTEPNSHSKRYTGAFFLTEGCMLKVVAVLKDYFDSVVVVKTIEKVWGIGDTLGKPDHAFTTGGSAAFVRVDDETASAGESMRSGAITDNQTSVLSTTVVGPGTLSFKWKTSCEEDEELHDWDHAVLTVDGKEVARLDGMTDWVEVSHVIAGAGAHTVTWTYEKDDVEFDGEDCLWVSDYDWKSKLTATQMTEVPVPYAWLLAKCPEAVDEYEVYERVAKSRAANPAYTVADCYVAGLDPEKPADEFKAVIEMDADGKPVVTWEPVLEPAEAAKRVYTVYGKARLDDAAWEPVTEANRARMRFFKVSVRMAR